MRISLSNVGKRYNRDWIFKGINYALESGQGYAILGGNGSGKSTLLQILSGHSSVSEGEVQYGDLGREKFFSQVSIAAPYVELLEEFTLAESIRFHSKLKPLQIDSEEAMAEKMELGHALDKELRHYSSGMKQRAKLGLAILSKCPVLLLDEPISNLDANAVQWYNNLLNEHAKDKLVVICSNQGADEHGFCGNQLNIEDYKQFKVQR